MGIAVAIRIRGYPNLDKKRKDTLKMLNLSTKCSCMIYYQSDSIKGMLEKVKDFIAFGEIGTDTLIKLFEKRAYILSKKGGSVKLVKNLKELGYGDIASLIRDIENEKISISALKEKGLKVPFRLNSPSKGFKNPRKSFQQGGTLGNWGRSIDILVRRMM